MGRFKRVIRRMRAQRAFLSWEDYQERVDLLELVRWQQATRRQTLANLQES